MAFLYFLVGHVYVAFEHWKSLLRILCFADGMVMEDSALIMELISDLYFQVLNSTS